MENSKQGPMFGNSSIDLDEETDGNISCSVKNHVSHAQKTIKVKPCPGEIFSAIEQMYYHFYCSVLCNCF